MRTTIVRFTAILLAGNVLAAKPDTEFDRVPRPTDEEVCGFLGENLMRVYEANWASVASPWGAVCID